MTTNWMRTRRQKKIAERFRQQGRLVSQGYRRSERGRSTSALICLLGVGVNTVSAVKEVDTTTVQ